MSEPRTVTQVTDIEQVFQGISAPSNDTEYQVLCQILRDVKRLEKAVIDDYAEPKKKAHQAHRSICDAERRHLSRLRKLEEAGKRMVATYNDRLALEQQRDRLDVAEQMEEAGASGEEIEGYVYGATETAKAEGVSVRQAVKWEITDQEKLPAEYMMPDRQKIDRLVRAQGTATKIPGVRVYVEHGVSVRA